MKFAITHHYEKNPDTVFKVLTDPDYLVRKLEYTGAKNIDILELAERDGQFIIKIQRDVPANPPAFAKRFLKSWNTVVSTDIWDDYGDPLKKGVSKVEVKGIPVDFNGTLSLRPRNGGCDYVIEFNIKVKVPLIGGKLEKLAEEDTRANQELDYEYTRRYLEKL